MHDPVSPFSGGNVPWSPGERACPDQTQKPAKPVQFVPGTRLIPRGDAWQCWRGEGLVPAGMGDVTGSD
eukprot:3387831-Rhodomonas_salina.1